MRGSLKKRYKGSWNIVLDIGTEFDPETGRRKRKQKWITVKGNKRQAEEELAKLLNDVRKDEYIQPSKMKLGEWLEEWLEIAMKPPTKRLRTYETYRSVIHKHIQGSFLAKVPLQSLQSIHLERYYRETPVPSLATQSTSHDVAQCLESGHAPGTDCPQSGRVGGGKA